MSLGLVFLRVRRSFPAVHVSLFFSFLFVLFSDATIDDGLMTVTVFSRFLIPLGKFADAA